MDDFASLVYPWPPALLPFVIVAFRENSEENFAVALEELILRERPDLHSRWTSVDAPFVYQKCLSFLNAGALPKPMYQVKVSLPASSVCSSCQRGLNIEMHCCRVLSFSHGVVPATCEVPWRRCFGSMFFGCLAFRWASASEFVLCHFDALPSEVGTCSPCCVSVYGVAVLHPEQGGPILRGDLDAAQYFPLCKPLLDRCVLAFVETKLLRFMTLAILHWRASFDGFHRVWSSLHGNAISDRVRKNFFHVWLYWRSQLLLTGSWLEPAARAIPLRLAAAGDTGAGGFFTAIQELNPLVRCWFLDKFGRQHRCDTCNAMKTVGVDNKVSLQTRLCSHGQGYVRSYVAARVAVDYGCIGRPVRGSRSCRAHALSEGQAGNQVATCFEGHGLVPERVAQDGFLYTCDICDVVMAEGNLFFLL